MKIRDVRHVTIVGLARQGKALARFWCKQGASVTITDLRPREKLQAELDELSGLSIEYVLGEHPLSLLDRCELLCLSGGVPPETPLPQEARRRGIPLINDSLLTVHLSPVPVVGITGSSGKTTTTTLVGKMLSETPLKTWVGGNIGTPLIDRIDRVSSGGKVSSRGKVPSGDKVSSGDKLVLELSSFQLQLFDASPHVAAVLNVTPNHLDRHPSMAHYTSAKAQILRWQQADDVAVLGLDDEIAGRWWRSREVEVEADTGQEYVRFPIRARRLGFSLVEPVPEGAFLRDERLVWRDGEREREVCAVQDLNLVGRHNVANVLAACAIAGTSGATVEAMRQVAQSFAGVAHRLELVRQRDGVRWYNDSIATAPERVVAALNAFDESIVLLAGGRDKHLPWEEMADLTVRKVRHLVLFGEAADLIDGEIERARERAIGPAPVLDVHRCKGLEDAVEAAASVARPGQVVLLSPGGTSFDAYRDFEARGQHFCELVRAL